MTEAQARLVFDALDVILKLLLHEEYISGNDLMPKALKRKVKDVRKGLSLFGSVPRPAKKKGRAA